MVHTFIQNIVDGNTSLLIHGDGNQMRAFCHVSDIANAFSHALTKGNNEIFNIGNNLEPISIKELADRIISLSNSKSKIKFISFDDSPRDRKEIIKKKNKITFQTGYGPSGLPHIGTFGEVARTTMMINALNHIEKINHELITFSDDMNGLRKVPDNVPNYKVLKDNLGKP